MPTRFWHSWRVLWKRRRSRRRPSSPEFCRRCGADQPLLWWATPNITYAPPICWTLCPLCFTAATQQAHGTQLFWTCYDNRTAWLASLSGHPPAAPPTGTPKYPTESPNHGS